MTAEMVFLSPHPSRPHPPRSRMHTRIQIGTLRPIRVDHTNCLQVALKTHSFIHIQPHTLLTPTLLTFMCTQVLWCLARLTRSRTSDVTMDPDIRLTILSTRATQCMRDRRNPGDPIDLHRLSPSSKMKIFFRLFWF